MTVSDEELMAYADGALAESDAARVAAAVAADPALAGKVEAQRRLRTLLRGTFDPVAAEPVPEDLTLLIAAAAAQEAEEDMTDARPSSELSPGKPHVIDLAAIRRRRMAEAPVTKGRPRPLRHWRIGLAVAATLVLGLMIGTQLQRGTVTERNGALLASGDLARGLETRLASAPDGNLRILASFRRRDGDYCRVYAATASAGIACKDSGRWVLEHVVAGDGKAGADYRQAGSGQTDLMAKAQDMAAGDPLDAAQEREAAAGGWRK
ncbi:MAG: transcriptional regulator [Novosphingobium sp.]|nr:transcriptional regulator [Novosphingobium sp.]